MDSATGTRKTRVDLRLTDNSSSISPATKIALVRPKRRVNDTSENWFLYMVCLRPFKPPLHRFNELIESLLQRPVLLMHRSGTIPWASTQLPVYKGRLR